jgi:hypothetical protein
MLNSVQHLAFWTHLVRSRIKSGMTGPVLNNLFWTRMRKHTISEIVYIVIKSCKMDDNSFVHFDDPRQPKYV